MSTIHDDKMISARVGGKSIMKPEVVVDYITCEWEECTFVMLI
jgi:hypothetical protein